MSAAKPRGNCALAHVIPAKGGIRVFKRWVPAFAGTTTEGQRALPGSGGNSVRIAFYDFDGTIVGSNIVVRYALLARRRLSKFLAAYRTSKLVACIPFLIGTELYSRSLFNRRFFRQYAGMESKWLAEQAEVMFEKAVLPLIFPGARELVEDDRRQGYRLVLLSGELDFVLRPVVRFLGSTA